MSKTVPQKVAKRVRKGVKAAEKSITRLTPGRGGSAAKVAGVAVAGVAVAGVAGVAGVTAAVRRLRKGANGRATLHVRTEGDQWVIAADGRDGPIDAFRTKEEAVHAARNAAAEAAPSELVIHRLDGSVMDSHCYEPA